MTRPGIEPRSPGPLANTLTPRPMSGNNIYIYIYIYIYICTYTRSTYFELLQVVLKVHNFNYLDFNSALFLGFRTLFHVLLVTANGLNFYYAHTHLQPKHTYSSFFLVYLHICFDYTLTKWLFYKNRLLNI